MQLTDYSKPTSPLTPPPVNDTWKTKPTPLVVQALTDTPPGRVLDIGSYTGRTSLYLARQGWEVIAIDTDSTALATLQTIADTEKLPVTTLVTDIREYAPDRSFDTVLCMNVLHFLPERDIASTITRIQQWTRLGGSNIVSAFTTDNPTWTRPYLFPPGNLKKYYDTWSMRLYEESYTGWVMPEGKTEAERYMVVRLVATKPTATE